MITSIDKALAQQIVNTVKDVCGFHINFINKDGIIFASTDEKRIGCFHEIGQKAAKTETIIEVEDDKQYAGTQKGVNLPVYNHDTFLAVVGISGEPDEVRRYAYLAERITQMLIREKELNAFSRTMAEKKHYIIQSLVDRQFSNTEYLMECLKEFKMDKEQNKRMILVKMNSGYNLINLSSAERKIQQMFENSRVSLFTHNYPNEYLAVIEDTDFKKYACVIRKFAADNQGVLKIAVGKGESIFQLADSYESAVTAMKSLSDDINNMAVFDDLTLEIVLSAVDDYGKEEFLNKTISKLNEEEIAFLRIYFEENMSLAHTCERLYLHKNTVQNRLDRIWKKCGFNPRKFREGVVLYLAVVMKGKGE